MLALLLLLACADPPTCEHEGQTYDVKLDDDGPCCRDLTPVNTTLQPDGAGGCEEVDVNPERVCIDCGDGECGEAENACNCPDDCA
jgi:hypothetical protein